MTVSNLQSMDTLSRKHPDKHFDGKSIQGEESPSKPKVKKQRQTDSRNKEQVRKEK